MLRFMIAAHCDFLLLTADSELVVSVFWALLAERSPANFHFRFRSYFSLERAAPTAADPKEKWPSASVKGCFGNYSEVSLGPLFGVTESVWNPFQNKKSNLRN